LKRFFDPNETEAKHTSSRRLVSTAETAATHTESMMGNRFKERRVV
jgi:hypothetical protein